MCRMSWHDDRSDDLFASRRQRELVTTNRGRTHVCPMNLNGDITGLPTEIEATADRDNLWLFVWAMALAALVLGVVLF